MVLPVPLQIGDIVEVVDQDVVLLDFAGGHGRDDDGVRVEVAVVGDGRGQRDVMPDRLQQTARLVGAGGGGELRGTGALINFKAAEGAAR